MSNLILQHLNILGLKVKDKVTGFNGVATTVSFDLYGCIQAVVSPPMKDDGSVPDGRWFDVNRLEIQDEVSVMNTPNFEYGGIAEGKRGPAEKPVM